LGSVRVVGSDVIDQLCSELESQLAGRAVVNRERHGAHASEWRLLSPNWCHDALMAKTTRPFDEAYYRRFYDGGKVHDETTIGALVDGILGFTQWWGIEVRSVLDVGAGLGFVGRHLASTRAHIRYQGTDVSEYACREHGHRRVDIASWKPSRPFDLVMCVSVLQYLDDDAFARAAANLGAATRHLLYLELPTARDRRCVIDPERTDLDVHWRSGRWYRNHLEPWFEPIGAGLWSRRGGAVPFFELEAPALAGSRNR
jgi:SAM-dependent methyltransferase